MRAGLDAPTSALYTGGAYDTHIRLKVENGSGTFISLEGRYTKLSLRQPDPTEPIGSMSIDVLRDSTALGVVGSLSPLDEGSDWNVDDTAAYSPLLQIGRQVTLDANLTTVGSARPADGDSTWYEIFRGIIGKVDWPDLDKHLLKVQVDGLAAVLQHAKSEAAYTYIAGSSLETVVGEVLSNNGFGSIPTFFPAATGKVLPNNWAPGLQKTVWSQLVAIAQSMGWVVYYRYRGTNAAEVTMFEPARSKSVADHTVETDDFRVLSLDDAEVRNVGFLIYVDMDGVEQLLGPDVNSASLTKYGGTLSIRRPFWIKLGKDSPIRTATEAQEMLAAALSDVADPDIVAVADTMPLVFAESGVDLYDIPARSRFFDTAQKWALYSNEINFDVNAEPRSSLGIRGVPTAGVKSWRDLSVIVPTDPGSPELRNVRTLADIPSVGQITTRWDRNTKTFSVWAYLTTLPLPVDDTDNPWPDDTTLPTAVLPIGTDEIVVPVPDFGNISFLQIEPRAEDGEVGNPVRISIDPSADIPSISVSISIDEMGIMSANVVGNTDTASIKILASKVGQPSDGDTRLETAKNGRMFTAADIGTLLTLDVGETGYVTAFGYSEAGGTGVESTESVKIRDKRAGQFAPNIAVQELRSASVSTVTIDVEDRFLTVTAIEYKKRDGVEGGDTLDAMWQTAWTSSTGTIGVNTTLQRVIDVPTDPGLEGELQWRVQYTDPEGNTQTVGDSFKVVNLEETTKKVVVDHLRVQPFLPAIDVFRTAQYLYQDLTISTLTYRQSVTLPIGVEIVGFRARAFSESGGSAVTTARLIRIDASDVAQNISAVLTWSAVGSVSWKSDAVAHTTVDEESYQVEISLDNDNNNVLDSRFYRAEIEYTVPAYVYGI